MLDALPGATHVLIAACISSPSRVPCSLLLYYQDAGRPPARVRIFVTESNLTYYQYLGERM